MNDQRASRRNRHIFQTHIAVEYQSRIARNAAAMDFVTHLRKRQCEGGPQNDPWAACQRNSPNHLARAFLDPHACRPEFDAPGFVEVIFRA